LYEALNENRAETRFLEILPANYAEAPLICSLSVASLNDCSPYLALSYVWGSPENPQRVICDYMERDVTRNLGVALRQLRASGYVSRPIWIDALCINQADQAERASQVKIMGRLYESARQVIIWLGEESGDSNTAMEYITQWANLHPPRELTRMKQDFKDWIAGAMNRNTARDALQDYTQGFSRVGFPHDKWLVEDVEWLRESSSALITGQVLEYDSFHDESAMGAVESLLAREWWQRYWTIQEAVLAKDLVIQCGSQQISWTTLSRCITVWHMLGSEDPTAEPLLKLTFALSAIANGAIPFSTIAKLRRARLDEDPRMTLANLLPICRQFQASDGRDKIYALLGIATDGSKVIPDYEKPEAELYTEYAIEEIRSTGSVAIINHALLDMHYLLEGSGGLPLWVPRWSKHTAPDNLYNSQFNVYHFIGKPHMRVDTSEGLLGTTLRLGVIEYDRIVESARAQRFLMPGEPKQDDAWDWMKWIFDPACPEYPTGGTRAEAFLRAALRDESLSKPGRLGNGEEFQDILATFFLCLTNLHGISMCDIVRAGYRREPSSENQAELSATMLRAVRTYGSPLMNAVLNRNRTLFLTARGLVGISNTTFLPSTDSIWAAPDCNALYILCRHEGTNYCSYRGICLISGVMDGQIVKEREAGEVKLETLILL
jgi:hypothetical protein